MFSSAVDAEAKRKRDRREREREVGMREREKYSQREKWEKRMLSGTNNAQTGSELFPITIIDVCAPQEIEVTSPK